MKSLIILLCLSSFVANAADIPRLKELFTKTFDSYYHEGKCGDNILKLATEAELKGIDLSNAYYVVIHNQGIADAGLVQAVYARELNRAEGIKHWHAHVILIADNLVFDYDFTNKPRVFPLVKYLDYMFIPGGYENDLTFKKKKMSYYHFTSYPVNAYLEILRRRQSSSAIVQKARLPQIVPEFFQ
jgi:hypothetical protein